MIWLSEYRDVFIKNPFGSVYENSLLLTAIKYRGDYKGHNTYFILFVLILSDMAEDKTPEKSEHNLITRLS